MIDPVDEQHAIEAPAGQRRRDGLLLQEAVDDIRDLSARDTQAPGAYRSVSFVAHAPVSSAASDRVEKHASVEKKHIRREAQTAAIRASAIASRRRWA